MNIISGGNLQKKILYLLLFFLSKKRKIYFLHYKINITFAKIIYPKIIISLTFVILIAYFLIVSLSSCHHSYVIIFHFIFIYDNR